MNKKAVPQPFKKSVLSSPALILALSFLLPAAVLLIVYKNFGFYPFGDKSLLIMDLNGQSVDFYAYIRGILADGNSLLYSFQKGIGGNMMGLLNYYGSLPTLFLTLLFPAEKITAAIFVINLLKVGAAGLTMCIFLHSVTRKWDLSLAAFSLCYGTMTYAVIYSMQFQWLAGAVFLPLILLGIDRIFEHKKWGTFVLFYTLLLFVNTYTGYMATVFAAIYVLWKIAAKKQEEPLKKVGIFALSGILSAMLSAVWTLPSLLATLGGREGMTPFSPDTSVTYHIKNIYQKFFIGQFDGITNTSADSAGTASIFCGMLILSLALGYFFDKNFSLREKCASGGILLFFALSLSLVSLDKAWHLFSYPNWFPARWTFLIAAFLIFLAAREFLCGASPQSTLIGGGIMTFLLLLLYAMHQTDFSYPRLALLSVILIALYTLAPLLYKKYPNITAIFLVLFVAVEMSLSAGATVTGLDGQFGYKDEAEYETAISETEKALTLIKESETAPFYRTEKTFLRSDNDAMNTGYNGMTHYSSSFSKSFNNLDYALGMVQEWYACRYAGATPLIDALFGVRYIISDGFAPSDNYSFVGAPGKYTVYQNPNAFPLGFIMTGSGTLPAYGGNYLENQNAFYESTLGSRPFQMVTAESSGLASFTLTVPEEKPLYLSLPEKVGGGITVTANGVSKEVRDAAETKCKLLGTFPSGTVVTVTLPSPQSASFALLDNACLTKDAASAWENGLQITDFRDSHICGTVSGNGGCMMTTISYDEAWQVKIDGEKTDIFPKEDTFLAFNVPNGTHSVELSYVPKGLYAGAVLSILGIAFLLVFFLLRKKNLKNA